MRGILRLVSLNTLATLAAAAGTWSGVLVDSNCFTSMDNNRGDIPSFVNWDRNSAIEYCSPKKRSESFAVVRPDGLRFKLDATGNEKAAALLNPDHKSLYIVKVSGQMHRNTLKVEMISVIKRIDRRREK